MSDIEDALWDPAAGGDEEVRRLQALLTPYGARARGVDEWKGKPVAPARRHRAFAAVLAAGLAASVVACAGYYYRLAWSEGRAWSVAVEGGAAQTTQLAPGAALETGAAESLTVDVARIGRIQLSPQSSLRLLETRSGRHRVSLDRGHLRARIWAPPDYFGVDAGAAELVDLGCDFEVWKSADGRGRVYVRSGWIAYRLGAQEVLLPSGFAMDFNGERASTPLRPEASPAFAAAVRDFERELEASRPPPAAAERVADAAADADAFTLLSLLTRHPWLAQGALYPRLARALQVSADDTAHRAAWAAGDQAAIGAWWQEIPTQPKQWWANWADALP